MSKLLKVALYSAAAAGVAFAGRHVLETGKLPIGKRPSPADDAPAAPADDLTPQQREALLEELEGQLDA